MTSKCGVYRIRNVTNDKCYIGSTTKSFDERWREHRGMLRTRRHHSIHLQRAWNKYGEHSFEFEILLPCNPKDCLMHEQAALDGFKPEYNICKVAGSRLGTTHSKATRLKLRKAQTGKKLSKATRDKMSRVRRAMTYGKKPYLTGEKNHQAKLSNSDVVTIKIMLRSGYSCAEIGRDFGVNKTTIHKIKTGKNWSYV